MRMSVISTSGDSRRSAASAGSAASKARGAMPSLRSARSSTQRMEASSSTSQTRSAGVHGSSPRGSSSVNTVRPGSLSNSITPPLRVTSSCATDSPRPVPLARPVTSG